MLKLLQCNIHVLSAPQRIQLEFALGELRRSQALVFAKDKVLQLSTVIGRASGLVSIGAIALIMGMTALSASGVL